MNQPKNGTLDFVIDKLTNSIENRLTGEVFQTLVIPFTSKENSFKKGEWNFDWKNELKNAKKHVYKLVIAGHENQIQGLISLKDEGAYIYMSLIENANFNRGGSKMYLGVMGNLVAYACKISFERGYEGFVAFDAKTSLISHYQETLNAILFKGQRMIIDTKAAQLLVNKYFSHSV